jgi:nucleoside-diphosphate-sugar epimerase
MTKRILVTGSQGFIGSLVKSHFSKIDFEVIGLDKRNTESTFLNELKVNLGSKEEGQAESLKSIFPEIVVHCAAQTDVVTSMHDPIEDAMSNVIGSLELFKNTINPNLKHFVYLSSGGASYSKNAEVPTDESFEVFPSSPYGISKVTAENYLRLMCANENVKFTSLRLSNVYGPISLNKKGVIYQLHKAAVNGEKFHLYGPRVTRDYIYVDDLLAAVEVVVLESVEGIFNVATGIEITNLELLGKVEEILNTQIKFETSEARLGEVSRSCLSINRLRNRTSWEPRFDIESGLLAAFGITSNREPD